MAITLSGSVSASQTNMRLSGALTATPGELFRLGDELLEFGGYNLVNRLRDRKQVSFRRGVGGTTPATHANGTTLRRVADALASSSDESAADPFASGGGVTATDGTTTVNPTTQIVFPRGSLSDGGGGQAVVTGSDDDPFVIQAADGSEDLGGEIFKVKGEIGNTLLTFDAYGSLILDSAKVDPSNGGGALTVHNHAGQPVVDVQGNGNGQSSVRIGLADGTLGFYSTNPIARPEVPATPTAQDIVDALVGLGLVTQAS